MCQDYLEWDGVDPSQLHGVGQYAADAWSIFVWGERPFEVDDGPLNYFLERERYEKTCDT